MGMACSHVLNGRRQRFCTDRNQDRFTEGRRALPSPHHFHPPQSSSTNEDLLKSSEAGYFGPGNAQLPAPPMLMMDRITEISMDGGSFRRGHIVGELDS